MLRLFSSALFGTIPAQAPLIDEQTQEANEIRLAANQVADYLCTATCYANGKRIRERDAQRAIKMLDAL